MKKIFLLPFVLLFSLQIHAQRSAIDNARNEEFGVQLLIDDFLIDDKNSLFRGVEFDMNKEEVKELELNRSTVTLYEEDSSFVTVTTDLGKEVLDFADISYSFDDEGLYHIGVVGYINSQNRADEFYNKTKAYLIKKYGEGGFSDDDFYEILIEGRKYNFTVAIINLDYDTGFELYFYIK